MDQDIGILAMDCLVHKSENQGILTRLREVIPEEVEVLNQNTTALELLDFINNHKRLIVLEQDSSCYGKGTAYGEVEYWGYLTGELPKEIVVIGVKEWIQPVLDCLEQWRH
jgi:hypothetical protein